MQLCYNISAMNRRLPPFLIAVVLVVVLLVATGIYLSLTHRPLAPTIPQTAISESVTPMPMMGRPEKQETLSFESPVVSGPTASSSPVVELPELYPGVQWASTKTGSFVFKTRMGELIELDGCRIESVILKTYPDDFIAYYQRELTARGWKSTMMAGSGISGYFYGYEKDGRYITFGVFVSRSRSEYVAFVAHN